MDVVKQSSLLLLLSASIFFLNLGGPKLWDEDEPRNAGCAVEMMARGDWVVPWFNGQIRTHKPVLLYWFMISAYELFGVNEFAARFWSAALAVGTVMMTTSIGIRLLGRGTGLLGGIALSSMLMFVVASRAATPDSVLIFFMTASLAVYVWTTAAFGTPLRFTRRALAPTDAPSDANDDSAFPTEPAAIVLMYALMGMAALAKGPIGFLVPCAIIGMFLLIHRAAPTHDVQRHRWLARLLSIVHPIHFLKTCLGMRLGLLITSVLAVALPWYVWVTIRSDGEWTRGFFFEHNLGRAVNAMENHGGGPLYYVTAFLIGTFPWSIFFLPALLDLVATFRDPDTSMETIRRRTATTFLCCWVGVILGLFSLASTKLPSYITPCHPAAALLFAHFLVRLAEKRSSVAAFWPYASFGVLALVGLAISIVIPTLAVEFVPNAAPLLLVGVLLVIGACAAGWAWRLGESRWMVRSMGITACAFVIMMFGWGATRVSEHQQIDRLASTIRTQHPSAKVAHSGVFRSSWVFYLGAPLTPIAAGDAEQTLEFLDQGEDHYVIATDESYEKLMAQRPHEFEVVDAIPFFLEPDESLHLLQRASLNRIAAKPGDSERE